MAWIFARNVRFFAQNARFFAQNVCFFAQNVWFFDQNVWFFVQNVRQSMICYPMKRALQVAERQKKVLKVWQQEYKLHKQFQLWMMLIH